MTKYFNFTTILLVLVCVGSIFIFASLARAEDPIEIDLNVKSALRKLFADSPSAKALSKKTKGILVFPKIVKGGFVVGGQYGEGALLKDGKTNGYYNTVQLSYGFQAGLQKYGYALFFMSKSALKWLKKSDGWELGAGPTIVVIDTGKTDSGTTTTLQSDIYAFFFDQKGLMGGLGLQGTKVTKMNK